MTQEKLANELGVNQSTLGRWLRENNYKTSPMDDKAIAAARERYKIKVEKKVKPIMNVLCKGCPKGYANDILCASNGTQRRCPVYKYNREKRKDNMGIVHR